MGYFPKQPWKKQCEGQQKMMNISGNRSTNSAILVHITAFL